MTTRSPDRSTLVWRKSSYSSGEGQCVEIAWRDGRIVVRDSKQPAAELWFGAVEFGVVSGLR